MFSSGFGAAQHAAVPVGGTRADESGGDSRWPTRALVLAFLFLSPYMRSRFT